MANVDDGKREDEDKGGSKIKMGSLNKRNKPGDAAAKKGDAGVGDVINTAATVGETGNEVEVIQKLIQSLTQNCNPLKRSVDFITDDIESMNKEMEYWRNQYLSSKAKYQIELKSTEEALQPLQNKLAEIDEQIKEKKLRIQNVKAQIIHNEQKIQNLLYSVVTTK